MCGGGEVSRQGHRKSDSCIWPKTRTKNNNSCCCCCCCCCLGGSGLGSHTSILTGRRTTLSLVPGSAVIACGSARQPRFEPFCPQKDPLGPQRPQPQPVPPVPPQQQQEQQQEHRQQERLQEQLQPQLQPQPQQQQEQLQPQRQPQLQTALTESQPLSRWVPTKTCQVGSHSRAATATACSTIIQPNAAVHARWTNLDPIHPIHPSIPSHPSDESGSHPSRAPQQSTVNHDSINHCGYNVVNHIAFTTTCSIKPSRHRAALSHRSSTHLSEKQGVER